MKNKIGAEKIISVYWFAILFLVAGAVVFMVSTFYGNPYDVRYTESNILISNVADCISENPINDDLKENFLELCHLNFETNNQEEYYVEIEIFEFEFPEQKIDSISVGNVNLKENPNVQEESKYSKKFYLLSEGKELIAKINVVINKAGQNVKE